MAARKQAEQTPADEQTDELEQTPDEQTDEQTETVEAGAGDALMVEPGTEVDLGDVAGHLVFPDGGVSSHRGPARLTEPGEYRFVPTDGSEQTTVTVEG